MRTQTTILGGTLLALALVAAPSRARADGDLKKVNHIIIVMQENHSFDNYFGALSFAPGSPYHRPDKDEGKGRDEEGKDDGCAKNDHRCVDGLACTTDKSGQLVCFNANRDADDGGHFVMAFHDSRRCVVPDLDHSWVGSHQEANFKHPNNALKNPRNDGFVMVNDLSEQIDNGVESPTEDQTMGFYTQAEIPFYYDL